MAGKSTVAQFVIVIGLAAAAIAQTAPANECQDESRPATEPAAPYIEKITVTESPSPYQIPKISSATKTSTPLRDLPQSVTVITQELMRDQLMMSIGDVVKYIPGITSHQGENNRDQIVIRGN